MCVNVCQYGGKGAQKNRQKARDSRKGKWRREMFNVFLIWTIVGDGERGLEELLAPVTGRINTAVNNANLSYQLQGGSAHTDRWLGDDFFWNLIIHKLKGRLCFHCVFQTWLCSFIFFVQATKTLYLYFEVECKFKSSQICIVLFTKHVFSMQFYRKSMLTFFRLTQG